MSLNNCILYLKSNVVCFHFQKRLHDCKNVSCVSANVSELAWGRNCKRLFQSITVFLADDFTDSADSFSFRSNKDVAHLSSDPFLIRGLFFQII